MVRYEFEWSLLGCCSAAGQLYALGTHDPSLDEDIPVSALFCATDAWKQKPLAGIARGLVAITKPGPALLVLLAHAAVVHWSDSQSFVEAPIDASEHGPQAYGMATAIRAIDGRAYVVGMGRTVYCWTGSWQRVDDGIRDEGVDDDALSGLLSIDGFSDLELYAAGINGELWRRDEHGAWRALPSLTNLSLFHVCCAGDGLVYACGQRGVLLVGRGDRFRVIDHGCPDDLWAATWFRGRLYLSASSGIYALVDDELEPVETGRPSDCYYRLHSDSERMWSVGAKLLLSTSDGHQWVVHPSPPPPPKPETAGPT